MQNIHIQHQKKDKVIVVIPARSGSKGIPKKNIAPLNGKPLMAYTIEAAFRSNVTTHIYVSTDSEEFAKIALQYGAEAIMRPENLSNDLASTEDVLIHAIEYLNEKKGISPELVMTLPPTSPLRSSDTIASFFKEYKSKESDFDAMTTFTKRYDDMWISKNGVFARLFPDAPRRRQEREPLFLENSAIYITKTESLLKTNSILGNRCAGFVIQEREAVDINEPMDLLWAEFLMGLANQQS